jgi:hypothetical protein
MRHYAPLTVSDTPAAVTIDTLKPPLGAAVVCVTPPLKVAVKLSAYFKTTKPEPPLAPAHTPLLCEAPPPEPVLTEPFAGGFVAVLEP